MNLHLVSRCTQQSVEVPPPLVFEKAKIRLAIDSLKGRHTETRIPTSQIKAILRN